MAVLDCVKACPRCSPLHSMHTCRALAAFIGKFPNIWSQLSQQKFAGPLHTTEPLSPDSHGHFQLSLDHLTSFTPEAELMLSCPPKLRLIYHLREISSSRGGHPNSGVKQIRSSTTCSSLEDYDLREMTRHQRGFAGRNQRFDSPSVWW